MSIKRDVLFSIFCVESCGDDGVACEGAGTQASSNFRASSAVGRASGESSQHLCKRFDLIIQHIELPFNNST